MTPSWLRNLRSRTPSELRAKSLTLGCFLALYFVYAGIVGFYLHWQPLFPWWRPWPAELTIPHQAALYVPIFALAIYFLLHLADRKWPQVRGLASRVDAYKRGIKHREFASSAISRLSIHNAIGLGLIAGVREGLKQGPSASGMIVGIWAYCVLGSAVLFGMVAVLCYAHADRWETDDPAHPKRGLLREAKVLDQLAFYGLIIGMIWALALYSPALSLAANFVLGLLLWLYYFDFSNAALPPFALSSKASEALAAALKSGKADEETKWKTDFETQLETAANHLIQQTGSENYVIVSKEQTEKLRAALKATPELDGSAWKTEFLTSAKAHLQVLIDQAKPNKP